MAGFQLSPGVQVTESDLTNIVPAVATTAGGFVGLFNWGPVEQISVIGSENVLVERFGKPDDSNAASFFTAASFLSYGNNLQVVRVAGNGAKNAVANASANAVLIKNQDDYDANYAGGQANVGEFAARYPGELGNSIAVVMFDGATASNVQVVFSNATVQAELLFTGTPGTSSFVEDRGGSGDEVHVAVFDATGKWTGRAGTLMEKYEYLSKASDAKNPDGTSNYYKNVINGRSNLVYWMDHPTDGANWGSAAQNTAFDDLTVPVAVTLVKGVANNNRANITLNSGFALFGNDELVDVSLIPLGDATAAEVQYVIDNVVNNRRDCVAFFSPMLDDVVNNVSNELTDVLAFRDSIARSTSYAFMDSGWKYMYDRYNDVYRWVPLNGDTAGLCARTDAIADPWFSPGGLNRGQIKNAVRLAWSPNRTERDYLYKNNVNPVVTFPGEGIVLYGDKTFLSKPSAFDRINVRRLFIILEKAIATAAKYSLFEFNDAFTQAQFRNMVEPFLRDVQGRRGINRFRVVCDATVNTPVVVDRNEFVANIYIAPNRSINFITLNFFATPTGVVFEELGA